MLSNSRLGIFTIPREKKIISIFSNISRFFSDKLTPLGVCVGVILGMCVFGSIVEAVGKTSSKYRLGAALPPMKNEMLKRKLMHSLKQVSLGNEHFSLEFLKRIAGSELENNFIVSPFSIWSLLLLLTEGSDGKTHEQLQQVLGLPDDLQPLRMSYKYIQKALNVNTSGVEVEINQALFSDENQPISNDYSEILERVYDADQVAVNLYNPADALQKINQYVKEKTHGKIDKILDELTDPQLILISTLFFHGKWKVCVIYYNSK